MSAPLFVPVEARPGARIRLVIFPHAGGGPASAGSLAGRLPGDVEVWSVSPPGRQARLAEPPRTDLDPFAADLAADLTRLVPEPFALFGYCSGALLAYLTCRALERPAARLIVGSFAAPDVAVLPRGLHALPSDLFWDELIGMGGVPDEIAARESLRPVLEPALRADFGMLAGYRHRPAAAPLGTPITVLYGRRDTTLTRGGLLGWRRQTAHRPVLRGLDASHWLAETAPDELAAVIAEELGSAGCVSDTA
ncbi:MULTISPECIES: thioesterase II family protein [unclassified Spirillospora]|uniref:thioesterase II family protein n=1 Tax=unclassified Spirillospora TaxID=2642701 RepID=UPI003714D18C